MKTRYLFPHIFKKIGLIIFIPAAICGLLKLTELIYFPEVETTVFSITAPGFPFSNEQDEPGLIKNDIVDEVISLLIIIGAILTACSREKYEDEYIARIRLESLLWATYVNYALLLLAILLVYGSSFYHVMVCNMFTLLLIFLVRFNFILFKNTKNFGYEK